MLARINRSRSAVPILAFWTDVDVSVIFMKLQSAICAYSTSVQVLDGRRKFQGLTAIMALLYMEIGPAFSPAPFHPVFMFRPL